MKLTKAPHKYIKTRKINSNTIPAFENLLSSASWDSVLKENRPDHAYNNFFDIIENATNLFSSKRYFIDQNFIINKNVTSSKKIQYKLVIDFNMKL